MKTFFKELFDYSHQTNLKYILTFEGNKEKTQEKALKLMGHILNAHHIWNSRIEQRSPLFTTWDLQPVEKFNQLELENYQQTLYILDNTDLDTTLRYSTSTGIPMQNTIRDMLFQVVNHSTYHRAQITTDWKQSGIEVIPSDYIFFKR